MSILRRHLVAAQVLGVSVVMGIPIDPSINAVAAHKVPFLREGLRINMLFLSLAK